MLWIGSKRQNDVSKCATWGEGGGAHRSRSKAVRSAWRSAAGPLLPRLRGGGFRPPVAEKVLDGKRPPADLSVELTSKVQVGGLAPEPLLGRREPPGLRRRRRPLPVALRPQPLRWGRPPLPGVYPRGTRPKNSKKGSACRWIGITVLESPNSVFLSTWLLTFNR